jgi:hypothetical protein
LAKAFAASMTKNDTATAILRGLDDLFCSMLFTPIGLVQSRNESRFIVADFGGPDNQGESRWIESKYWKTWATELLMIYELSIPELGAASATSG